ncbi:MAG TPA: hypothetical protein VJT75_18265 [Thermoleophilaceae bacterium]|nr:hypothetical protein [Thermoleophilaceae bacterium]
MGRLLVAALAIGLAAGLAIGLTRDAPGPVLPRIEAAIAKDARTRYGRPVRDVRCVRFQFDRTKLSCTAVHYETALAYSGKLYIAQVLPDGGFRYHPYGIPIWKGV